MQRFPLPPRQQLPGPLLQLHQQLRSERCLHRLLQQLPFIRQTDPIGRKHTGQRMQQHLAHPQQLSQGTGVLAAGAPEAAQHGLAQIVAPLDRHAPDRFRHALQGHGERTFSRLLRRAAHRCRQRPELLTHRLRIQRQIALGAKYRREQLRLQAAQQQVGIGDRERPAAAVTGRARIGPCGCRAHREPQAIEVQA